MTIKNFTISEFCDSDKAKELGIVNTLPAELLDEATETLQMMQDIRDHLSAVAGVDVPVKMTSGYRCLPLNKAVGSGSSSDHPKALAVDFRAPKFGSPTKIARELSRHVDALGIGQLILEHPDTDAPWVHVSRRKPAKAVNRVITITKASGPVPGIRA